MIQKNINSLSIWFFENFLNYPEICHFISTRMGGFSLPPYDSLNLGFHVGDSYQNVLKNRKILASTLGFTVSSFVTSEQVHLNNVAVVTEKERGLGSTEHESAIKGIDGMVTKTPEICLMVLQADCVPVLFYDPEQKVIGIAHAGWGGTITKVAENTISVMAKEYNSVSEDVIVGIGPSIGPCCYEVKLDVVEKVQKNLGNNEEIITVRSNKYYLDLWKANKIQLLNSGVAEENINIAGVCTRCNNHIFFSARASKNNTGRFGAGIMIRDCK